MDHDNRRYAYSSIRLFEEHGKTERPEKVAKKDKSTTQGEILKAEDIRVIFFNKEKENQSDK